jgi:hypothetical protein
LIKGKDGRFWRREHFLVHGGVNGEAETISDPRVHADEGNT